MAENNMSLTIEKITQAAMKNGAQILSLIRICPFLPPATHPHTQHVLCRKQLEDDISVTTPSHKKDEKSFLTMCSQNMRGLEDTSKL